MLSGLRWLHPPPRPQTRSHLSFVFLCSGITMNDPTCDIIEIVLHLFIYFFCCNVLTCNRRAFPLTENVGCTWQVSASCSSKRAASFADSFPPDKRNLLRVRRAKAPEPHQLNLSATEEVPYDDDTCLFSRKNWSEHEQKFVSGRLSKSASGPSCSYFSLLSFATSNRSHVASYNHSQFASLASVTSGFPRNS